MPGLPLKNAMPSGVAPEVPFSATDLRSPERGMPYGWRLVLWLWLAHFLNQADRQVYSIVLPQLSGDLHMSAVQAGLVASLFVAALAVCVPIAGWVGDHVDRKRIIVVSLAFWSASTLLSGMANGMAMLIIVRSFASAAGEAFYTPAAYALIGQYHQRTRSRAMSLHQTALYAGIISSGVIAGWIADHFGWRYAFLVFGFAGILMAGILQWKLRSAPSVSASHHPSIREALPQIVRIPSLWGLAAAFGSLVFVNVGFLTWMPTYLHGRFHLSLEHAGFTSMFWHHIAALSGVMLGGWISDRLAQNRPSRRVDMQAFGLLCGAPFLYWIGTAQTLNTAILALVGFGLFRGVYDSNIYPSLFEVVPEQFHATASGLMIACAFLFGALAPIILGFVKQNASLDAGFPLLCGVFLAGAACLWIVSRFYFRHDRSCAQAANLNWRMQR